MTVKNPSTAKRPRGRPRSKAGAKPHRVTSEQIEYKEANNLHQAIIFAQADPAKRLTTYVTIQWSLIPPALGKPTDEPSRCSAFISRMGKWLSRKTGQPPVWVMVREGGIKKGVHLHLMIHVPQNEQKGFKAKVEEWLSLDATGLDESDPKKRPVDVRLITPGTEKTLESYFLKEGTDAVHEALGVRQSHRNARSGIKVTGKRIAISHSVGPTARTKPV